MNLSRSIIRDGSQPSSFASAPSAPLSQIPLRPKRMLQHVGLLHPARLRDGPHQYQRGRRIRNDDPVHRTGRKGLDYVFLAGIDLAVQDIDIYVYDEVGSLILDDRRPPAAPA